MDKDKQSQLKIIITLHRVHICPLIGLIFAVLTQAFQGQELKNAFKLHKCLLSDTWLVQVWSSTEISAPAFQHFWKRPVEPSSPQYTTQECLNWQDFKRNRKTPLFSGYPYKMLQNAPEESRKTGHFECLDVQLSSSSLRAFKARNRAIFVELNLPKTVFNSHIFLSDAKNLDSSVSRVVFID